MYTELRGTDGKDIYQDGDGDPNNSYTSYDDDVNGTIGLRFSWPLQSTCNNETIELMQENDKLRQELELLANCAKYKDLELGPEFATVREMCKGVNKPVRKCRIKSARPVTKIHVHVTIFVIVVGHESKRQYIN